jgi:hypothetical protein
MTTCFIQRKAETPASTEDSASQTPVIEGNFGLTPRRGSSFGSTASWIRSTSGHFDRLFERPASTAARPSNRRPSPAGALLLQLGDAAKQQPVGDRSCGESLSHKPQASPIRARRRRRCRERCVHLTTPGFMRQPRDNGEIMWSRDGFPIVPADDHGSRPGNGASLVCDRLPVVAGARPASLDGDQRRRTVEVSVDGAVSSGR